MRMKTNQKGFTLIELMIVIAIIGILAAVAIPNYIAFKNKAYCTATVNDVKAVGSALADYFAIPSNTTAVTSFVLPGAPNRPYILFGRNAAGAFTANTLLLSASTTLASAVQVGSNYILSATEGAGNCPLKVTLADTHWTGGGGNAAGYVMTL